MKEPVTLKLLWAKRKQHTSIIIKTPVSLGPKNRLNLSWVTLTWLYFGALRWRRTGKASTADTIQQTIQADGIGGHTQVGNVLLSGSVTLVVAARRDRMLEQSLSNRIVYEGYREKKERKTKPKEINTISSDT